jgi:2-polyprenyl-6-methoxyphenol hydroxylase-like FAD-dependent oxidoreductase
MSKDYDAIVVGTRCAGAPTALLLARAGHRVLMVDKATFPSDTMSTHLVHPPGIAALARWGLLERLEATDCPPITRYSYDFGPIVIAGSPRVAGAEMAYCPRRIVLDTLLVEAAVAAGAELREAFTVDDILVDDGRVTGIRGHAKGGATVTERARVVIGADGKHSLVAKTVQAERYNEVPTLASPYYTYWSGLPTDGFEVYVRPEGDRAWGTLPTHDDLTVLFMTWPRSQFQANRKDVEGSYMTSFDLVPEFAERIRAAKREARFVGAGGAPNVFRVPYGPGWALVGDAGYHKDPIAAFGITDAFRDAESLAMTLDDVFAGRRPYDEALAGYQRARDEAAQPIYELTCDQARFEVPQVETQQLLRAMQGNQEAMDGFVSVMAGTRPVHDFFSPDNIGRIIAHAAVGSA